MKQLVRALANRLFLQLFARHIVAEVHAGIIDRHLDEDMAQSYVPRLGVDLSIAELTRELATSSQSWKQQLAWRSESIVADIYDALLNRQADSGGQLHYAKRLIDEGLRQTLTDFILSDEFRGRAFSEDENKTQLLDAVYRALLGRPGDVAGIAHYKRKLNVPADLEKVIHTVVESHEFRRLLALRESARETTRSPWGKRVDYVDALYRRYNETPATPDQLCSYIASGNKVWEEHRRFLSAHSKTSCELRVLLFGAFGNGNIGDIYQAVAVKQHLVQNWGVDSDNVFACSLLNTSDYPFRSEGRLASSAIYDPKIVNSFDYLVVGGGGLLAHPHNPLNEPAWAEKITVPIVLLGVGATRALLADHQALLDTAVYVSARDRSSLAALESVRADTQNIPDPILSIESAASLTEFDAPAAIRPDTIDVLWLLKHPANADDEAMLAAAEACIAEGRGRHVIVAIEPSMDRVLSDRFPQHRIEYVQALADLLALIRASSLVFSMRYHGIIFALMEGRRTMGASQVKIKDLLTEAGVPHGYLHSPTELQPLLDAGGVAAPSAWLRSLRQRFADGVRSILPALKGHDGSRVLTDQGSHRERARA